MSFSSVKQNFRTFCDRGVDRGNKRCFSFDPVRSWESRFHLGDSEAHWKMDLVSFPSLLASCEGRILICASGSPHEIGFHAILT